MVVRGTALTVHQQPNPGATNGAEHGLLSDVLEDSFEDISYYEQPSDEQKTTVNRR